MGPRVEAYTQVATPFVHSPYNGPTQVHLGEGEDMAEAQNLTQKLLAEHLLVGDLVPGEEIDLTVDQVLIEDATGSMTALQFEELNVERISVPLAVMYVDHNVLQVDDKNMNEHRYLQSF